MMNLIWDAETISQPLIHVLKTIDPYFDDVWNGLKLFEFRPADRPFKVNDFLALYHYPENDRYITANIGYILRRFDDRFIWFDENVKGCIIGITDLIKVEKSLEFESGTYTLGGKKIEPFNTKRL